jgi:hypothetical protein
VISCPVRPGTPALIWPIGWCHAKPATVLIVRQVATSRLACRSFSGVLIVRQVATSRLALVAAGRQPARRTGIKR